MQGTVVPEVGIWQLLFESEDLPFPEDHVLFQDGASKRSYTFQDLRVKSAQFGTGLRSLWSWKKGDVLVLMSPNCVDTPLVTWGCHYTGGIVAPVNPGLSAHELQQQIVRSKAKGMVVHPSCLSAASEAARLARLPTDRVLVLGDTEDKYDGIATVTQFMSRATESSLAETKPARISPDDVAFLVYSSGTTGLPKGVMVSHRNVVADVVLQAAVEGPHVTWRKDRTLAVLPTYHIYGLICLVHLPVRLGTTTVFMSKFDLPTFCSLIREHSITHVYVAPPIVLHLAKSPSINPSDLISLRMITSGGAPLGAVVIQDTHSRWKIPIRQAYGLSETTSVSHIQRWNSWNNGIGSNGPVVPGVEAKIVVGTRTAAVREEGELCIRGPTVFNGYLDDRAATAACLTADGWFQTGDIGFEDELGNLHITDRAKDMIKFKGFQIAPTELEDILLDHPAVGDAAVIGVWNEEMQTEVPLAYLVRKRGGEDDVGESEEAVALAVMEYLKGKVVQYKHLRGGVVWVEKIPKSPSGKILKRELRDRLAAVDKGKQVVAPEYARYRMARL